MRKIVLIVVSLILLSGALTSAYVWLALSWSYSTGERAGLMQKISRKGWLCKTWEGELLLTSMPGAIPEKFEFSVRDEELANQLMEHTGQKLVLTYAQHKGIPTSCFGDTEYFVEKMVVFKENKVD
ncbi:MAG: hypothetical protein LW714_02085 [Oxalobacteraceae bacterium]|jgi:hypothetical protein|nr:hypothetical protein [Oxalobacteraceae bacterium]